MRRPIRNCLVSLVGVSLAACSASAQEFELKLILTSRLVQPQEVITDIQTGGIASRYACTRHRIELRYRIDDLIPNTRVSRGLASAAIRISATGAGFVSFQPTRITYDQLDSSSISNPDVSSFELTGISGLIGVFRTGLTDNTDPRNGSLPTTSTSFLIVPQSPLPPNHNSESCPGICGCPSTCGPLPPVIWGVFTFDLITSASDRVVITASAVSDAVTGERFRFFERTGTVTSMTPTIGTLASDASLTFSACADANFDGAITVQDVFTFLASWFSGSPLADADCSQTVNLQDIFAFLARWFAPCS